MVKPRKTFQKLFNFYKKKDDTSTNSAPRTSIPESDTQTQQLRRELRNVIPPIFVSAHTDIQTPILSRAVGNTSNPTRALSRRRSSTLVQPSPTLSRQSSVHFANAPTIRKKTSGDAFSHRSSSRILSSSPTRSPPSSVHFSPSLRHRSSWTSLDEEDSNNSYLPTAASFSISQGRSKSGSVSSQQPPKLAASSSSRPIGRPKSSSVSSQPPESTAPLNPQGRPKSSSVSSQQPPKTAPPPGSQGRAKSSSVSSQQPFKPSFPWSVHRLQLAPPVGLGLASVNFPSPSPFPRHGFALHANATPSGEFFLFGGFTNNKPRKDLYRFSSRDRSATLLQTAGDIPSSRTGHASALVNNVLVVWGGDTRRDRKMKHSDAYDNDLYMLNIVSRQWTLIDVQGPRPSGRCGHTLTVLGTKIFLFGGEADGNYFNDLWVFDFDNVSSQPNWVECRLSPSSDKPGIRSRHTSVIFEDNIYISGGRDEQSCYSDTWVFDTANNNWSELQCTGSIPSPRNGHAAALIDGIMYVIGGRNADGQAPQGVAALTISSRRWSQYEHEGSEPSLGSANAMVSVGPKIYVLGGEASVLSKTEDHDIIHIMDTSMSALLELTLAPTQSPTARLKYSESSRPTSPHLAPIEQATASDVALATAALRLDVIDHGTFETDQDTSDLGSPSESSDIELPWFDSDGLRSQKTPGPEGFHTIDTLDIHGVRSLLSAPTKVETIPSDVENITEPLGSPGIIPALVTYKNLVSLLSDRISNLQLDGLDTSCGNSLQKLITRMHAEDPVRSLLHSSDYKGQLMSISLSLGCHDDLSTRQALDKDELDIIQLLYDVLESDAARQSVLLLKDNDAELFLTLIHNVLEMKGVSARFDRQKSWYNARRLLVKLSENGGILPPSLTITGVENCEKEPVAGGGFADIFRASYKGEVVALKRLRDFQIHQERQVVHRKFCKEAILWQGLHHANVLPFYGIDLETFVPRLSMVSPWMHRGTVLKHIADVGGPQVANIDRYLFEIAHGLQYLHSHNVIHGDLRGTNIFIDDQWHARLADFGLAGFADATLATHTSTQAGSIRWMSPELHNPEIFDLKELRRTKASDVYAFACVALEVHTANYPFSNVLRESTIILKVMQGERPDRPEGDNDRAMSDELWNLVELCWGQNPAERPTMAAVIEYMRQF